MSRLSDLYGVPSPSSIQPKRGGDLAAYLRERANFHGVDPELAASVFQQESSSGSNPGTSPAGARGPMQVMPGTFKSMYPEGNIDDPYDNIEAGIRYLAHGKKVLGTDDRRLLAAGYYQGYNRDSLKRGEIVDTNPDPRFPSVQSYADQVAGRAGQSGQKAQPRPRSGLKSLYGVDTSEVAFPLQGQQASGARKEIAEPERTWGQAIVDAGRNFVASGLKIGPVAVQGVVEAANMVTGGALDEEAAEWKRRTNVITEMIGSGKLNEQHKAFAEIMADDSKDAGDALAYLATNPGLLADEAISTLGSLFLPAGASAGAVRLAAARGASKAAQAKVAVAAAVGSGSVQNAASTFTELKDQSTEDRYAGAAVSAVVSALVGFATGGGAEGQIARKLADDISKGRASAKRGLEFLKAVGKETGQEAGEEGGNIAGEALAKGEAPTVNEVGKRTAVAGAIGGVVGAGVDVATGGARPRAAGSPANQPPPGAVPPNQTPPPAQQPPVPPVPAGPAGASGTPGTVATPGTPSVGPQPTPDANPEAIGLLEDELAQEQATPEGRPIDPETGQPVDRRADLERRRRVDEMTPEEMRAELLLNSLTKIPNRRAYEEQERAPVQVSIDADGLKWINDTIGHHAGGNRLLQAVADVIASVTPRGYHFSGDEFAVEANSLEEAQEVMAVVQDRLNQVVIVGRDKDGNTVTLPGVGVSFGIGATFDEAETNLARSKDERAAAGLRDARGGQPARAIIQPPAGQPGGALGAGGDSGNPGSAVAPGSDAPQPAITAPQAATWMDGDATITVVPLSEALYNQHVRPRTAGKPLYNDWVQRYGETLTHLRLLSRDGGQTWKPAPGGFIGPEEKLMATQASARPAPVTPSSEQPPVAPEAESQAPVAASGEAQGDGGVAPTQDDRGPDTAGITDEPESQGRNPLADTPRSVSDEKRAERTKARKQREAAKLKDPRRQFLNLLLRTGGVNISEAPDITGENRKRAVRLAPGLFRKNGRGIDDVALYLYERGYITEEQFSDVDGGAQVARDLIRQALDGEQVYTMKQMDEEARRQMADHLADEEERASSQMPDDGGDLSAEDILEILDETEGDIPFGDVAAAFDAEAALRAAGITDKAEIDAIIEEAVFSGGTLEANIRAAIESRAAQETRAPDPSETPGEARGPTDGQADQVTPPSGGVSTSGPLELTGQTEAEARAEAERVEKAKRDEERKAAEAEEADRKRRERQELKDRQQLSADDFQLGQNDQEILDGFAGQGGLFNSPVDEAAHDAATSPTNDLPEPTDAQKEAGNYQKGHTRVAGLDISIENPQGSTRFGTDEDGKAWTRTMRHHYGYILGTVGRDKDHIDVFVKPGTPEDFSGTVFVVDQKNPATGKFDEHKVMLGFDSLADAKEAYRANYEDGWRGMQAISARPLAEFKQWLAEGDTMKPMAPVSEPKDVTTSAPDLDAMFDDVLNEEKARVEAAAPKTKTGWERLEVVPTGFDDGSFVVQTPPGNGERADGSPQKYARFQLGSRGQPIKVEHFYEHSREPVKAFLDAWAKERSGAQAPAPAPAKKNSTKRTGPSRAEIVRTYYAPGNVVPSYDGFDEVLSLTVSDDGSFSVKVHAVTRGQASGQWVRIGKPQDARTHSTMPTDREIKAGPKAQLMPLAGDLVPYTEGRADGKPFSNAPDRGAPATGTRTAGQAASSAAKNAAEGFDNAIKGLGALFGGKGRLGSGLQFDEETYAKAVPFFKQAAANFKGAASDIREVMRAIIRALMEQFGPDAAADAKPYAVRFAQEVLDGKIDLSSETGSDGPTQSDRREPGDDSDAPATGGRGAEDQGRGGEGGSGPATGDDGVLGGASSQDGQATGPGSGGESGGSADVQDARSGGSKSPRGNVRDGRKGTGRKGLADDGAGDRGGVTPPPPKQPTLGNYHIEDPEALIGGTPRVRFARNRDAIEAFRAITDEGRDPTPQERDTLARYIGWGSFGQELFNGSWESPRPKEGWEKEDEWLRAHLGEQAWKSAQRSIINAHYTDPPTVMTMWDLVMKMGFKGGRVLEPSMGIGNFFGLMPKPLKEASQLAGIELDQTTGGMAKLLYPDANIQIKGYEESNTADNFYDLVIGNWPFAKDGPPDRRYRNLSPSLHDYFFVKALDQVRPGGIVIGITSSGTMDKVGKLTRLHLAKNADLIGSFRLPSGAFEKYAGTAVVTDIIILKKRERPNSKPEEAGWIDLQEIATPAGPTIKVNEYYAKNPDRVLGTLNFGSGTTQGRAGMIVDRPADLMNRLTRLPDAVPANIITPWTSGKVINYVTNNTVDRENSVTVGDGNALFVVSGEYLAPLHEVHDYRLKDAAKTKDREAQVRALVDLRRKYGALIDAERESKPDAETLRTALNRAYQAFVKAHGTLNESYGLTLLRKVGDPYWSSLAALEQKKGDKFAPATILSKPTMRGRKAMDKPSIRDALVIVRNESMLIDLDKIASMSGAPLAKVREELVDSGMVFETPGGNFEARDVYLSGNVRRKLREAKEAVEAGKPLERNVSELEKVVPENVPYYQIEAKLGAPWVSPKYYQQFLADLLSLTEQQRDAQEIKFRLGNWKIKLTNDAESKPEAKGKWGTSDVAFGKIVRAAFNNTKIVLRAKDSDGREYVLEKETQLANEKAAGLREEFGSWIWKDYERKIDLEREYNEVFNSEADPQFDGSFLSLEGMALQRGESAFSLRRHQINAIWRGLANRRGLYAHEVGTGKTYTMGGLVVESRRYGIARKPLILAHNANSKSVAREINEMYPGAKILYLGGIEKAQLPVAMRQIANDDWDAIIVPHSKISMFGLRKETLMRMAQDEIMALEMEAQEAAAEKGIDLTKEMMDEFDDPKVSGKVRDATAKELVKARNAVIKRIEEMAAKATKEDSIPFEELGIDMVVVDEAHEFGKPPLATKMQVRGLNKAPSQRSMSLMFLTSFVRDLNGGTGVHLFTGTPITNTLNEIYNHQRYVANDLMNRDGVSDWDSWFNTFADSSTDVELSASGQYEPVTRLAAFVNVAELRRMIGSYTDIVFADDMPEFAPRPTDSGKTLQSADLTPEERTQLLDGRTENPVGRPYKRIVNDVAPMSREQMDILKRLQELANLFKNAGGKARMEMMKSGHPASPVLVETNASNAAMDARLYDMSAPDTEFSKSSRVTKNVLRHYGEHPQATQVIFLERGYTDESVRTKTQKDGTKVKTRVKKFNLVDEIVGKLVAGGIPPEQIAVVSGGVSDEKKREIAEKMNRAEIRVVIGQTATLGVGVNMQVNLRAMHHMDAPWRPGDLEQRNGRGHRQGNKWNTVLEYRYITDRLDGRRWQVLAVKQRFIQAFLRADKSVRVIEGDAASMDEDGSDILESLSEAAGDPRILLLNKYKQDVERLESKQRSHDFGRQDSAYRLSKMEGELLSLREHKNALDADAKTVEGIKEREFEGEVGGKAAKTRKEFDDLLAAAFEALPANTREWMKVGTIYGIPIRGWVEAGRIGADIRKRYEARLEMRANHGASPSAASLEATLRGIPRRAGQAAERIVEVERSVPAIKEAIDAPFPRAADLEKRRALLAQVEADLDLNPVPPPSWLRTGAPVGTEARVFGKVYPVAGHQYSSEGYFVIVETPEGSRRVPYMALDDENGLPQYEPHTFEKPPVQFRPLRAGDFVIKIADGTIWKVLAPAREVKQQNDSRRLQIEIEDVESGRPDDVLLDSVKRDPSSESRKEVTPALELTKAQLAIVAKRMGEPAQVTDEEYLYAMGTAFSEARPGITASMRSADVDAAIAPILRVGRGLPRVNVVQRQSELPKPLVQQLRSKRVLARGAYYDGEIYLVSDNIESPDRAVFVMLHEALHFGLRKVFGQEVDAVMMKAYRENAALREAADKMRADARMQLSIVQATQEVIADWAGEGKRPSFMQKIVAWVRDWFRRRGIQLRMTDADVLGLIGKAEGAWKRDPAWTHVYSDRADLSEVDNAQFSLAPGGPPRGPSPQQPLPNIPQTPQQAGSGASGAPVQKTWGPQTPLRFPFWKVEEPSAIDNITYSLQDKFVDTKRVIEAIKAWGGKVRDALDPYLNEELYHGRVAKRTQEFLQDELKPLLGQLRSANVTIPQFEEYLHNRHAEERNAQIAKINPNMPDGGSGINTKDARDYLKNLDPRRRQVLERLAQRIDAINRETRQILIGYGLESPDTIAAWEGAYQKYVPLFREDMESGFAGNGTGQGFSVRGSASRRATGSDLNVVNILANIALQRERALVRGEKNRVATALWGLAKTNPNPEFWRVDKPPIIKTVNPQTNLVEEYPDPNFKSRANVVVARIPDPKTGKVHERAVIFNERSERAVRMATAIKNLDTDQVGFLLDKFRLVTRYFSQINTQWNPIFGMVNFARDVQSAAFNLTSTPLAGRQLEVMRHVPSALRAVFRDERATRKGKAQPAGPWDRLWREFQEAGGQTGYRDMFADADDRAKAIEKELKALNDGKLIRGGKAFFGLLTDYNTAIENSTRLAAYKAALDAGMTKERAASLAKNLTVNFNRKGQIATQANALYAFFNASVQGTARMWETLTGPAGKAIVGGGILLGIAQALALSDFEDDEPPQFVRERNLVIPIGGGRYLTIPMPLGLHVLPNIGRVSTEFFLGGMRNPEKRVMDMLSILAESFNPVGNAGWSMQTVTPTALDPFAALAENRDWTGRPIYREDFSKLNPTPGFTRAKDIASPWSMWLSYWVNRISGGTDYRPGALSPTPDAIDYFVGQATGGVGREISKGVQVGRALGTGEEIPAYKIPIFGRLYGRADGQSSQAASFYSNLTELAEHEAEIKGRAAAGEDVAEYVRRHPEAQLWRQANTLERRVAELRRRKRALMEKGASREEIQGVDNRITEQMRTLNEAVTKQRAQAR